MEYAQHVVIKPQRNSAQSSAPLLRAGASAVQAAYEPVYAQQMDSVSPTTGSTSASGRPCEMRDNSVTEWCWSDASTELDTGDIVYFMANTWTGWAIWCLTWEAISHIAVVVRVTDELSPSVGYPPGVYMLEAVRSPDKVLDYITQTYRTGARLVSPASPATSISPPSRASDRSCSGAASGS